MNQLEQQDSVYYTSRTDKPRRLNAPPERDKDDYRRNRDWRNGISKRHKHRCEACGGIVHERGKHLAPAVVRMLQAKTEREAARAAACGYGTGQDTPGNQ